MMHVHHHLDLLFRWDRALVLQQAIREAVKPGMRVLDAGTGSGVLALWAAQAGADEVVGVDMASVEVAEAIARANGLSDRVRFVSADLRAMDPSLVPGRFDLVTAMLYYNDPRRDEAQQLLTRLVHDAHLVSGGARIPGSVGYQALACEWTAQDLESQIRSVRNELPGLENRYGLKLGPLADDCLTRPSPAWFPVRADSGRLDRGDARILSDPTDFARIDYDREIQPYPDDLEIAIASEGIATGIIWVQTLWAGDRMIMRNEAWSWLARPRRVVSGDKLRMAIDDGWRRSNALSDFSDLRA